MTPASTPRSVTDSTTAHTTGTFPRYSCLAFAFPHKNQPSTSKHLIQFICFLFKAHGRIQHIYTDEQTMQCTDTCSNSLHIPVGTECTNSHHNLHSYNHLHISMLANQQHATGKNEQTENAAAMRIMHTMLHNYAHATLNINQRA